MSIVVHMATLSHECVTIPASALQPKRRVDMRGAVTMTIRRVLHGAASMGH